MEKKNYSTPISLKNFQAADGFWKEEMELVRKEVLPYQWEILNDRVADAAPSFCMRNFKIAGKMMQEKREKGDAYQEPEYTFRGFETLPEDMEHLEDQFYGYVFQDSDFSKWIEAVAYSLMNHPDEELEKTADAAIDLVCAAQQENGYLDTYYIINGMDKAFTNLREHHELYCFGHLTEGAVAYYQATGKDKLLKAVIRFADYIDGYFGLGEGKCKGYPGHEIAEMALVRLYEVTGEKRYLELSRFFVNQRGQEPVYFDLEQNERGFRYGDKEYLQAHRPVREQDEAVGHAVRAMYLYSGMADVARETGDETLWDACKQLWHSAVHEKMYITGAIGGTCHGEAFSYPFDLPNDLAYAETCASIGLMFWARRMLEIERKAEYADVMEQALYNTVLAGMALDGKSFFYVNPLEVLPEACHKDARKEHVKPVRQKWFGCACCPPNLARLISSIPSYAYTEDENSLYMHLYISGVIRKIVDGKEAEFTVTSGFPWDGKVTIAYTGREPVSMELGMRIPGWCADDAWNMSLENCLSSENKICSVGDWQKCAESPKDAYEKKTRKEENGYVYVSGEWIPGDYIKLNFPMEVKLYQADYRVRESYGKVAVMRGPLVYCAEEVDNGTNLHLYRLCADAAGTSQISKMQIQGKSMYCLNLAAEKQIPQSFVSGLYQAYKKQIYEEAKLTMIPYFAWANRGENEMRVWMNIRSTE